MLSSDRRVKRNIVRVGDHPLGIGLYLFDYDPERGARWGHDRQFGVMADEVEAVMPAAVSVGADGYKQVDYAMLGIRRAPRSLIGGMVDFAIATPRAQVALEGSPFQEWTLPDALALDRVLSRRFGSIC